MSCWKDSFEEKCLALPGWQVFFVLYPYKWIKCQGWSEVFCGSACLVVSKIKTTTGGCCRLGNIWRVLAHNSVKEQMYQEALHLSMGRHKERESTKGRERSWSSRGRQSTSHILLYLTTLPWTSREAIASLVAQSVKNLPAMQETQVRFLGWEDPLEKGKNTHSSILAWRIQWTEEPGGLQSIGSQELDMTEWLNHTAGYRFKVVLTHMCGLP